MFSPLQLAKKYIHYWLTASNGKGHGIHSPFVFDFVKHILNDTAKYHAYERVETLRSILLKDNTILEVEDMGAGSVVSKTKFRKVSGIARNAVKPKEFGQLLFRIVQFYKPELIVELGTSLGLTTSYLALANEKSRVISMEGASSIADKAETHFKELGIKNIKLEKGNFDNTLPDVVKDLNKVDLGFIDGNHRREATLLYFKILSEKINTSSILIFDDIHWSEEMEDAWKIIKSHSSVTLSIDLFFIGLVFFRKEFKIKQHFTIRY